ncbi:DUF4145 domain-containing protein [Micrococcus luteus]|uniref:hypothetical protein n=1 Tax=Micrococcus luteus TaxID=1270 RepID=UPI00385E1643
MSSVFKHDVAVCPYCGEVSTFDVDGRIQLEPEVVDFTDTDWERITSTREVDPDTKEIIAIRCRACAGLVILMDTFGMTSTGEEAPGVGVVERRVIDPPGSARRLPDEAPELMASFFQEAGVCEAVGALRAAGGLYRSAAEAMLDSRVTGRDIPAKVNQFVQLPEVDPSLAEELKATFTDARLVGREALHHGVDYSAQEIGELAELLCDAAEAVFAQPAQRQRRRQRQAQRIHAAELRQQARKAEKGKS